MERRGDRAPARGAAAPDLGERHVRRPPARGPRVGGGARGAGSGLTRQALAARGVEEVQRSGVHPQLRLLALLDLARGVEARDDLVAPATGNLARARVLGELGELVGLDALGLDREVGVELRAHRLEDLDLRAERDALVAGVSYERGVLEVLGPHARHDLAGPGLRAHALAKLRRERHVAERQLDRVA